MKPLTYICAKRCVYMLQNMLEQTIDMWKDGYGVVQIVTPEENDATLLRFCYYKDSELVNRPLTTAPTPSVAEQTSEVVETMSSLAHTFSPEKSSPHRGVGRRENPRVVCPHLETREEPAQRNLRQKKWTERGVSDFGNPVVGVRERLSVFGQECNHKKVAVAGEVVDEAADSIGVNCLQGVD